MFGRLRFTRDQVLDMSPRELKNAIRGYFEQENEYQKDAWERARLVAYYALGNGKQNMKKTIPLPWDNK